MTCIATFYSHFGAIRFKNACAKRSWPAKLMPVPRTLSSSCGTCVRYEASETDFLPEAQPPEELEQIAEVLPASYRCLYRAEDS